MESEDAHPNPHALFSIPGVSILNVAPDLMHCKHLGTDQHFYGSVVKLLVNDIMPGSKVENEEVLWQELSHQYKALKSQNRLPLRFQ